jgi:hypothetical protein
VANFLGPRPPKKTTVAHTQPEIKLEALTANLKLDMVQRKVQIKNKGGAMKKAALHFALALKKSSRLPSAHPARQPKSIPMWWVERRSCCSGFKGADKLAGLAGDVYNCADFASNPEAICQGMEVGSPQISLPALRELAQAINPSPPAVASGLVTP